MVIVENIATVKADDTTKKSTTSITVKPELILPFIGVIIA